MQIPKPEVKIGEKTVVSIHIVIVTIMVVIWLVRLSDRVEVHERLISELQDRLQQLETSSLKNGVRGKRVDIDED